MPTITQRIRSGWNAFIGRDPTDEFRMIAQDYSSYGYGRRPDRMRFTGNNQRSIVASVYNRISVDVASIHMEHAKLDENGRYKTNADSGLNECINISANTDQTGKAFIQDVVESMFDEGVVAVVPVDTSMDPRKTSSYDIYTLRSARIVEWRPQHVKVHLYDEMCGRYKDIWLPKFMVAIIENPFYSIMNEPNSTLQRLIQAINKLNAANDNSTSSKLDLIIQLPYVTKSPQRKAEALKRRKEIEEQLSDSKLGIAYTDGTEKVTQLNRSLDNNLWTQVKELTAQLYSQLGVTPSILDGTADEATRINYFNSTIAPICDAITDEFERKFLTKTARTQGNAIIYFRDPFKLVPVSQLADIADKFTRNEIMTSNELRGEIGLKPSDDPKADKLMNSNLNMTDEQAADIYGSKTGIDAKLDDAAKDNGNSSLIDGLLKVMGNQSI